MAVVRSLFGRFSRDASSDLRVADNIVCLNDYDRVVDNPVEDFVRGEQSDVAEKFTLGIEPADSPKQTLGELMTRTREASGLSREEVAEQTHIPAYYVRMIESDCYDAIPDQLYLLPFFRRYAIFLGLDAQKVVARFLVDFEKSENEIVDIKALKVPKAPKAAKTPAVKNANAKTILLRRQVASGVLVAGLVLTFLTRGFGFVGGTTHRAVQNTLQNPADSIPSSASARVTPPALPPSIILSSDEPPPAVAEPPAAAPSPVIAAPEVNSASASPAIEDAPPPTPAKHHRRKVHSLHGHRLAKHSKHATHKPG
jgi:cytoskeletal protein RodZ